MMMTGTPIGNATPVSIFSISPVHAAHAIMTSMPITNALEPCFELTPICLSRATSPAPVMTEGFHVEKTELLESLLVIAMPSPTFFQMPPASILRSSTPPRQLTFELIDIAAEYEGSFISYSLS
jgi:hypothetical protein